MNESFEKPENWQDTEFEGTFTDEDGGVYMPDDYEAHADRYEEEQELLDDEEIFGNNEEELPQPEGEEEIVGFEEEEPMVDDLDSLLQEFLDPQTNVSVASNNADSNNGNSTSASIPLEEEEVIEEPETIEEEEKIVGPDPVLDGPHGKGNSVHGEKTMDRIEEAVDRITRMVVESLCKEEKKCKCGKKNCTCKDGECTCEENVNEGQGWNLFKHGVKNFDSLPDNEQEYDEFFQDGELTNYEHNLEGRPYYDNEGGYTDDAYDKHGMRHDKVEDTTLGRLGRKAGVGALKAMSKGKIAKKKWDLAHPEKQDGIAYLQEAIDKIVKEEVTKLDVWGKHPRYRKEPMSTPANKDVKAGTADKDWCDDSVKGNQAYGQKIGSSAPFEKEVDALTEKVFEAVKKTLVKKTGK